MAAPTKWTDMIPQALRLLESETRPIGRQDVEILLDLKPRRALQLMKVAGAVEEGRTLKIYPEDLARYLMTKVDAGILRRESERQARFADWFARTEREFQRRPHCFVEIPDDRVQEFYDATLDRLPAGVRLWASELVIHFDTAQELRERLLALGIALAHEEGIRVRELVGA